MNTVTSRDGTLIVFDRLGAGPPVIIVSGILDRRSQQAPLADALAERFTVFNYDRRGHGGTVSNRPYRVGGEAEDLQALVAEAGGSACVYGASGGAILALELAGRVRMRRLAVWEPSYRVDHSRPPVPADLHAQLVRLEAAGRRGDMVELFLIQAVGMPPEFVQPMRESPWWLAREALAHTLVDDLGWLGDYSLPARRLAAVTVPVLVADGGTTPWLTAAAEAVAAALPCAERRTLAGQAHNVVPEAIAPVLGEFFSR